MEKKGKMMEMKNIEYEGPFSIQIISGFAKFLSDHTVATENVRRKLYRVFIELAQNVALYSLERVQLLHGTLVGKGKTYIIDNPNEFQCITINKIEEEHAPVLIKNCAEINATPLQVLRAKKKKLYRQASFHDTGAHIGLIMIYTYSENPIDVEIITDSDGIYFKITATINKHDEQSGNIK